jgi:alkylhydroperoxidase family enzyme
MDNNAGPEVRAVFRASTKLLGRIPNFYRTLAHSPRIATWMLPLNVSTQRMGPGSMLDGSLRELAIVKTSLINACKY